MTAEVDEDALYHYLTFMTTPPPGTLFRDIGKIPAGHMLTLTRGGEIKLQQYWDALPAENSEVRSDEEHKTEILRLLRDSIRKRMMSDVPFGVFLSGGVDSSANVALMSEQMSRPVETFTVGFSDAEYLNELESARRIGPIARHHDVVISEKRCDFSSGRFFTRQPLQSGLRSRLRCFNGPRFRDDVVPVAKGGQSSRLRKLVRTLRSKKNFGSCGKVLVIDGQPAP